MLPSRKRRNSCVGVADGVRVDDAVTVDEEVVVGVADSVAVVEAEGVSEGVLVGVAPMLLELEDVCEADPVPDALEVPEVDGVAVRDPVVEVEGVWEEEGVLLEVCVAVAVCDAVVVGVDEGVAGAMRGSTGGSATERQRVRGTGLDAMGAARPSPVVAEYRHSRPSPAVATV